MFASEASIVYKKIVFRSKKLLFQPFLKTAKNENGFLSNFTPISDNLINKLLHQTLEQSCLRIPFSFLQFKKKAKNAIFWSKIHFFRNVARFARKLLSIRTLLLTYSKLVGTPCITKIFIFSPFFKFLFLAQQFKYFSQKSKRNFSEAYKTMHSRKN